MDAGVMLAGAAGLMGLSGAVVLRHLLRPLRAFAVPVLRYRFVGPPLAGSPFNTLRVSGPAFAQHMNFLKRRGFHTVTLAEAWRRAGEQAFLDSRPVALCFDGGYESLSRIVAPRMTEMGFTKATLFVSAESIGADNAHETAGRGRPEAMLTEEQLRALHGAGWEIGSLGGRSRDLTQLSPQDLTEDLRATREALEGRLQAPIKTLAFPRDVCVPQADAQVLAAGFDCAAWVSLDGLLTPDADRFRLPRYSLTKKSSLIELALVLAQRMA